MESPLRRDFALPSRMFRTDGAWRQCADTAAILPDSDKYVATTLRILEEAAKPEVPKPHCLWVNYEEFTFPVFRVKTDDAPLLQDVEIVSYEGNRWHPLTIPWYRTESGRLYARGIPQPLGRIRPSGPTGSDWDGALILFNPDTQEEYDFWQVTTRIKDDVREGGGIVGEEILSAGAISWFRVSEDAHGCQLPICDARDRGTLPRSSSRASGLPYLAGLLTPEDLSQGQISHALAFTLPRLRHIPCAIPDDPPDYVYPATCTETTHFTTDHHALAAGMRIRLKSRNCLVCEDGVKIDESEENERLAPVTRLFFKALREYGAYLVDGGGATAFAAEDYHTAWLELSNAAVAELVGQESVEDELKRGSTKWQVVMDKLVEQLSGEVSENGACIPFATRLANGTIRANFDVVENAVPPDVNWLRRVTDPHLEHD